MRSVVVSLPKPLAYFGLGYCSRGMLKGRLAIPLHDQQGRLIGYAGRVVNDSDVSEKNPRYRFPGKRERAGKVIEFRKTRFLYNGYRFKTAVEDLIVVEGFVSVWWFHQNGFSQAVATMGSDCSDRQAELIISLAKPDGRIWIIPDGNEAGERLAESLLQQLSPFRFVRWVKLENGKQPTDLTPDILQSLLGT
jgi:DNA primase